MWRKLANSFLFASAAIFSVILGVLIVISIWTREKVQNPKIAEGVGKPFLADQRRAMSFYRVFSTVYDSVNPPFYSDAVRDEVTRMMALGKEPRVLDVGCGTGYTTAAVLKKLESGDVIGIDLTPQQLRKAKANVKPFRVGVQFCRGDVENLPFRNEVFDAVVSVGAVEYFPNPAVAIREMARTAKKRARVVVGGPELGWFRRVWLDRVFYTPSYVDVRRFFLLAKLENVTSELTGVDTFFGTSRYVAIVAGRKPA